MSFIKRDIVTPGENPTTGVRPGMGADPDSVADNMSHQTVTAIIVCVSVFFGLLFGTCIILYLLFKRRAKRANVLISAINEANRQRVEYLTYVNDSAISLESAINLHSIAVPAPAYVNTEEDEREKLPAYHV